MGSKILNFMRYFSHVRWYSSACTTQSNMILNGLKSKINLLGPITVHDYMREALTDSKYGYYMNKDVFGKSGDFVTSPEITQIFGEMIAVWLLNEWNKLGSPKPLQLIELGPGRGTMMEDILRVYNQLGISPSDLSIHFVEVSQELSRIQAKNLCPVMSVNSADQNTYLTGVTSTGTAVHWHTTIHQVPEAFSCILAHEFFDALPIHILKKTERGWNEVLIDVDKTGEKLRYVLSNNSTPACYYSKVFKQ